MSKKRRRPHASIALVGNAPLDAADRPAVAGADFIIRFNWMHHRWLPLPKQAHRSALDHPPVFWTCPRVRAPSKLNTSVTHVRRFRFS